MNQVGLYGTQGVYSTYSVATRKSIQQTQYAKAQQKEKGTKKIVGALAGLAVMGVAAAGIASGVAAIRKGKMPIKIDQVSEGLREGIAKNKAGRPITGTVLENLDDGGTIQRTFIKGKLVEKIEQSTVDGKKVKILSQYSDGKKTLRQINKFSLRLDDDGHVIKDLSNTKGYIKGKDNYIVDLTTGQPDVFNGSVDDFKLANFTKIQNATDNLTQASQTPISQVLDNPTAQTSAPDSTSASYIRKRRSDRYSTQSQDAQVASNPTVQNPAVQTPATENTSTSQIRKRRSDRYNTQSSDAQTAQVASNPAAQNPAVQNPQVVQNPITQSTNSQTTANLAQQTAGANTRLEQLQNEYNIINAKRNAIRGNPSNTTKGRKERQKELNDLNVQIGQLKRQIQLQQSLMNISKT